MIPHGLLTEAALVMDAAPIPQMRTRKGIENMILAIEALTRTSQRGKGEERWFPQKKSRRICHTVIEISSRA